MTEYYGMNVKTLEEMLSTSNDYHVRRKIRAALREAQGLIIGHDGVITKSFNSKHIRKSSAESSPLNSPKSPKSPLRKSYKSPKSPLLKSSEDTSQIKFRYDDTNSKWFHKSPSLREKSFYNGDRAKFVYNKGEKYGLEENKTSQAEKKERIPSWREALQDGIDSLSSHYHNKSNNRMADSVVADSKSDGSTFKSYYHIGSLGVQHSDSNVHEMFHRQNHIDTDRTEPSSVRNVTRSDYDSPRHTRRTRLPSDEVLGESSSRKSYVRSDKYLTDTSPKLNTSSKSMFTFKDDDDIPRRSITRSVRSSTSEKNDRSPAGFDNYSGINQHDYDGSSSPKLTSRSVWRSSLQDITKHSSLGRDQSPRETTHRNSEKDISTPRRTWKNHSDSNLLESSRRSSETGQHNKVPDNENSVFEDRVNGVSESSYRGTNTAYNYLTRYKSDSNLLDFPVVSRTTSRASMYDSGSSSPMSSRKSSENNDNDDVFERKNYRSRDSATRSSDVRLDSSRYRQRTSDSDGASRSNRSSTSLDHGDSSPYQRSLDRSLSSSDLKRKSDSDQHSPKTYQLAEANRRYSSESVLGRLKESKVDVTPSTRNLSTIEEISEEILHLQEQLKNSTEFPVRRRIRASIRKLRDQKDALERCDTVTDDSYSADKVSPYTRETTPPADHSPDSSLLLNGYAGVQSIQELRRLLSEESDYDEKRKIRLALRQLRQKEKDRESGGTPVNGRDLSRSQSFIEQQEQNSNKSEHLVNGLPPTSKVVVKSFASKDSGQSDGYDSSVSVNRRRVSDTVIRDKLNDNGSLPARRYSSFIPDSGLTVFKSSDKDGNKNHLKSFSSLEKLHSEPKSTSDGDEVCQRSSALSSPPSQSSSSSNVTDEHSNIPSEKSTSVQCQKRVTPNSDQLVSPNQLRRFSLSAIGHHPVPLKDKKDKKSKDFEVLGKEWIENKKRSCSLPGSERKLSAVDMEAAFSELLSAVDKQETMESSSNDLELITEDINKNKTVNSEVIDELIRAGQQENRTKGKDSQQNTRQDDLNGNISSIVPTTPQKILERPTLLVKTPDKANLTTPEKNSAISIIEDDDGSVTVHSVSRKDEGDFTITEKTRLRRSESNTQTEERDTIIESKITSPGGSAHYEKDITQSKRKLTTRGSDYFSRTKYVINRTRNPSGGEAEQHDVIVETDNFSATKCEAWGDKAEATVQLTRDHALNGTVPGGLSVVTNKPTHTVGRMDVSKSSSGYGSVSGSDEEEKEDGTSASTSKGRPSDCPEIRTTLKDVLALEGTTAALECTVVCSPAPTITWYRDDKKCDKSARFEPKFDSGSGKATLTIKRVGVDDRGEYRCLFKNPLGEADTRAKLTVKKKSTRKPEFKKRLKEQSVTEGSSVELSCVVHEAASVAWYKDGIIQRNSADFKQTFDGITAKLEISEIFLDDKGEYSCVAKNDLGESKTSCKINVKECDGDAHVVPVFLSKPDSKILHNSDTLVLQCELIGTPQPVIKWLKDGSQVCPSRIQKETYDGRVAQLIIQDCTQTDSGKYDCVAVNEAGRATVDALVVVKAKQGPPIILHPLADLSAICGKSLILQCDVRASPAPIILWRKDGLVIGNTKEFQQTYENNMARLAISELLEQDGGCYECIARNSCGAVASMCNITILAADTVKQKSSPKLVQKNNERNSDWIVGRDKSGTDNHSSENIPQKTPSIGRSESMKVSPSANYSVRDRFRQKMEEENNNKVEKPKPASTESDSTVVVQSTPSKTSDQETTKNNHLTPSPEPPKSLLSPTPEKTGRVSPMIPVKEEKEPEWKNVKLRRTESARVVAASKPSWWREKGESDIKSPVNQKPATITQDTPGSQRIQESLGPQPEQVMNSKATITLQRSESARVTPTNRPSWWRGTGESDIKASSPVSASNSKDNATSVTMTTPKVNQNVSPKSEEQNTNNESQIVKDTVTPPKATISLRRSESARLPMGFQRKKDFLARAIDMAMEQSKKLEINNNNNKMEVEWSARTSQTKPSEQNVKDNVSSSINNDQKTEPKCEEKTEVKLSRTQSARLLFEQRCQSPQSDLKPNSPLANFLAQKSVGVRRTSSLRVTPSEKEAGWFKNRHQSSLASGQGEKSKDSLTTLDLATMSSYDNMDDEEELHKILSKTENFEERKKIRARMKEIREKKQKEWEEKRLQREKDQEDIVKKKFQLAEEQKKKRLEQFAKDAKTASAEREKILATSESLLQDKLKQADEDKKRHLEVFDKLANKDTKSMTTTTVKTENIPGGTKTTVIKKTTESSGFGVSYGKPTAEQAAKFLSDQLKNAASTGTEGRISVKTESWNSRDGVTNTTQKTESWGGGGAAGGAGKPNFLAPGGRGGGGGGRGVTRSPSAIKTMLLEWTKAMTKGYEGVEVTNFSSSWNNGMAFCALIHHFYPESFDFKKLNPKARRANFKLAFDVAEKVADIAPLLDVDDMVAMKNPDWKCVFTYVQSFYRKLHNHPLNKANQPSEQ